jgi:glycosyltransferase involved in cell wall biosynthesis
MDIGIVHPGLIYPRGAEKQVCKLSYYLSKMGHDVTIYTFEKEKKYAFDPLLENVDIISLNKKWSINLLFGANYLRWNNLIKKISTKIKNHDVINAHNHPAQWISKYTDIPTVWMCNEPYYKNVHGIYSLYNYVDQRLSSNLRLTLPISHEIEKIVKNRYPQLEVETVGSGADIERNINHVENDYFDSIFVGPLHPQKRQLDIIKAFSLISDKIPDARLHFVGSSVGILSNRLKNSMIELAKKSELEIFFYDSISNEELYNLYDIADISVFVPKAEPWGIFPLETILGGIPTIISDQCGVKDILPSDYPVVETENINQLSSKILEIKDNYSKYKHKTAEISKMVSQKYSWKAYSERMENIFQRCIR